MCVSDVVHPPACSNADMPQSERQRVRDRERETEGHMDEVTWAHHVLLPEAWWTNFTQQSSHCVCQYVIVLLIIQHNKCASVCLVWSFCYLSDNKGWEQRDTVCNYVLYDIEILFISIFCWCLCYNLHTCWDSLTTKSRSLNYDSCLTGAKEDVVWCCYTATKTSVGGTWSGCMSQQNLSSWKSGAYSLLPAF